MEQKIKKKVGGLAGIIAGKSAISTVGTGHGLTYRGYDIYDLTKYTIFEEVLFLLLKGKLPNINELNELKSELKIKRQLSEKLKQILKIIPKNAHPMDVIRSGISCLSCFEIEKKDFSNQFEIALRILAVAPSILLYWYHYANFNIELDLDSKEDTLAGFFLEKLHLKNPSKLHVDAMNVSLILYAEHEFNASTFTARIISSTMSDIYSGIVGAIGALKGNLHGGANEAAFYLIKELENEADVNTKLLEKLKKKEKIMGFGHRVYEVEDPRNIVIKEWSKKLIFNDISKRIYEVSDIVEKTMWESKKLFPNVDFYSASVYHFLGIPTPFFTPIFIFSRISGWTAHIFEQRSDNKLIRPASEYIGSEKQNFIELKDRK